MNRIRKSLQELLSSDSSSKARFLFAACFLASQVMALSPLLLFSVLATWSFATATVGLAQAPPPGDSIGETRVKCGDLIVKFLDNSQSPDVLSGVDQLFNVRSAPDFDAFDPHDPPASAGLNFEHIISGHNAPSNWFAPRNGTYQLYRTADPHSVVLVRHHGDDPWRLESSTRHTVTEPHYIDFEFSCRPHDAARFGARRAAVLFWANYMNNVEDIALHFRGIDRPRGDEKWIAADAPPGHPEHVGGGTYRHRDAPGLDYDVDHNLKLNMWSYEYPRFTKPFYYGRAANGMTLILMFDRAFSADDEMRFSLFKFKVGDQIRRPAWDFQYVIHRIKTGRLYGFRGRLVWKRFVSPEDCVREYETWAAGLAPDWQPTIFQPQSQSKSEVPREVAAPQPEFSKPGWQLPPTGPVNRENPRLMNYFHMDYREGRVDQQEERLAQWNLLILNHDLVTRHNILLTRIRHINPDIKILAWLPLQGPHDGLAPGVPAVGEHDWYGRGTDGSLQIAHWGARLMNVRAQDYGWPRHVLEYVRRVCLAPGAYDGLMLDCLWEFEPQQQDVNRDGVHDGRDTKSWQEGMLFLLKQLRKQYPDAILIGNGGGPWSDQCPYFEYANGCMHENALGNQFGGETWQPMWEGYRRTTEKVTVRKPYHLIAGDVQAGRRTRTQAAWVRNLSADDRRRARLGLATSLLLDGGYFGFDRGDCMHGQLWWLPEYDVDLGPAVGDYETDRYGPGTYSRQFAHGVAIVNPTDQELAVSINADLLDITSQRTGPPFVIPAHDARLLAGSVENP